MPPPEWEGIYRSISKRFGFTPEQVSALTFPQLEAYLKVDKQGRGHELTPEDIIARRQRGA